jgi:hypothetical protein
MKSSEGFTFQIKIKIKIAQAIFGDGIHQQRNEGEPIAQVQQRDRTLITKSMNARDVLMKLKEVGDLTVKYLLV